MIKCLRVCITRELGVRIPRGLRVCILKAFGVRIPSLLFEALLSEARPLLHIHWGSHNVTPVCGVSLCHNTGWFWEIQNVKVKVWGVRD